ncbi:hypothetical protein GA0070609_0114 [Micromonospora echinaurantiaca]|uniref:Uncharacterized protein n=1 Tax=Micromonospora echinaurantiaca TaxID=47857 RepID=A0A1C5GQY1_9ACTN|nr:hypothetical protein GA0070609_0114 [Micromonospora echinaurantiaca]
MKAHRTDVVSFAFGLIFVGLSAWWLLAQLLGLALPPVGWFLAGALIVIGLLGLVGALRSGRSANREEQPSTPATGEPATGTAGAAGTDPTALDLPAVADRPTSDAGEPSWPEADGSGWPTGRSDWEVSAPMSGAPVSDANRVGRDEADEWPTDAVTDRPVEGTEDRPADEWPAGTVTDRPVDETEDRLTDQGRPGGENPATEERSAGAPVTGPPAGGDRSRG